MKNKLAIGCSPLTNRIFIGSLSKDGTVWLSDKTDVTTEALCAVAEHCLSFGKPVELTGDGVPKITITVTKEVKKD